MGEMEWRVHTAGRRDGGTAGRRDGGTAGRREGGTAGRRDGGTAGQGDGGTAGQRDGGTTERQHDHREYNDTGIENAHSRIHKYTYMHFIEWHFNTEHLNKKY